MGETGNPGSIQRKQNPTTDIFKGFSKINMFFIWKNYMWFYMTLCAGLFLNAVTSPSLFILRSQNTLHFLNELNQQDQSWILESFWGAGIWLPLEGAISPNLKSSC